MPVFVKHSAFLFIGLFSLLACHRPTASVLPELSSCFTSTQRSSHPVEGASIAGEFSAQPTNALDMADTLVRNDARLATNKIIIGHLQHVKSWADKPSANASRGATQSGSTRRMKGLQQVLVKKLTKQLGYQRSSVAPAKTVLIEGILVLGAVLLLGGVLLVLLTSGTGFAVGVIALAAGLVCLLIGLL